MDLILQAQPTPRYGETLQGRLAFGSNDYYRSAEYQPGFGKEGGDYSAAVMDTLRVSGTLHFIGRLGPPTPH